ncbi:MAG TPA: hydroxysqualene dehydroxylase HpnE [Burkholderiaceae bacterium]|jgi:squalene-associated FAD-dependent desaturase|nr:hydroxysqualene dehydroxylase HpnE [Burkholderiaceae bacterium]HRA77467.1 hydroxysqualene dehydroxylase HpnE [Burkholderiaceae bacterium]
MPDEIAIVGAGWAGLSAAVRLTQAGRRVRVFEAAPAAGGRAREARLDFGAGPVTLDAGQHLLVGAYRECLELVQLLHDGAAPFERHALSLRDTAGLRLHAPRLPAPLHLVAALLGARGLSPRERLATVRLLHGLRGAGWRAQAGETVAQLLQRCRQPGTLVDRLWSPLCMAALNTDVEEACATTFATVLRDTLGSGRAASDFVLPRSTLDALLARPACDWLRARGAQLAFGATVRTIARANGGWRLQAHSDRGAATDAAQLVLAVPPYAAARLLAPLLVDATTRGAHAAELDAFVYDAITTVYLAWPASARPSLPRWVMLRESRERGEHGQWLFDRGRFGPQWIAAVVISARGRLSDLAPAAIADGVAHQVADQLRLPPPTAARTVTEKRATFRCTPQRPRVEVDAFADVLPGLWLAGDFAWPDYPATLEGAVRSGRAAAERALGCDPADARRTRASALADPLV